ncbi:MAG: hypothetical protein ACYS30_17900 [Planctomycetota bacterium]
MKYTNSMENIIKNFFAKKKSEVKTTPELDMRIMNDALPAQAKSKKTKSAKLEPNIWRTIMKSKITKFAAATAIIIAVIAGLHYYRSPVNVTSVAWGELVERVEQSHDEYMNELLLAFEEKDTEKVNFYSHLLEEFWQKLGWLARAKLDPEFQIHMLTMIADQKWLGKIEDMAWINETAHVCKQLEEYGEEIRDVAWHSELTFSYVEHCMPSFVVYCEWFEQLPWDNPEQVMTPAMLLTGIQRDLNIARRELETLEIRDVPRFVKRCVEQTQKNVLDLDKKTASSRTKKQRDLCRQLTRRIEELSALIIYAEIATQDLLEQLIKQNQYKHGERYDQVLTEEFGNKASFADYYIERIDQSLDLCKQLSAELESIQ